MDFIKNYIKSKSIPFYIGLGASLLSIVAAIVYAATLGHLVDYVTGWVTALLVVAPIIYIALSFVKLDKVGMFAFTGMTFASLIVYILTIYEYPIKKIMDTPDITKLPEFMPIVTVAALIIVVTILGNVLCWLNLTKKPAEISSKEGETK